jgi:hypothetical protein
MFLCSCDIIENLTIIFNFNQSDILRQRNHDLELKKYCVKLLEMFGSLSYTRQTLEEIEDEIMAEVAKHGGNPMLEGLLYKLLEWKRWTDEFIQRNEGLFCHNNASNVLVCLVANSYHVSLSSSVPQTLRDYCGKCVVMRICSMGILYVANSMQYFVLN